MPYLNKRRRSLKNKKRRRSGRIPAVAVSNVAIKVPDLGNNSSPTSSPTEDDYSLKSFIDMAEKLSVKFPSDEVLNVKINENTETVRDNAINLTSRLYSKIKDAQDFDTIISGFGYIAVDEVEKVMEEIGFGNSKRDKGHDRAADAWMGVTTYSGGWKMKMQLCAATLMNADILMLDEPTGHLDVTNIHEPKIINDATKRFYAEQDLIAQFISDKIDRISILRFVSIILLKVLGLQVILSNFPILSCISGIMWGHKA